VIEQSSLEGMRMQQSSVHAASSQPRALTSFLGREELTLLP
jgi:hypothetical protein